MVMLADPHWLDAAAPGAQPPDHAIHDLIFLPGFSTAAQVTEVSGRGVGLDVEVHVLRAEHVPGVAAATPAHERRWPHATR